MNQHRLILKALQSELWAITPEGINQIIAVAKGMGDPEALMTKVGKPLSNTQEIVVRDSVAIMPVIGPIFRYANLFTQISGATSIQTLATDFQTALDDRAIEAIILDMNTPGGQIAGISEFAAQIYAAQRIKPVYAYVSDLAASAGYWLAAPAREIIAADTSRLGSIGVVMQAFIGEDAETIEFISSQSPFKRVDPQSDQGKIQNQKTVDALAEVFINAVATYRDTTREAVIANFGQGGMHIAADAIGAGMADRLGSLELLISQLSSGTPFSTPFRQGNFAMNKEITLKTLEDEAPELLKAVQNESYAAGIKVGQTQGSEAERTRIQGIEELATLGHDKLIAQFKFDGQTTAAEAALKILSAEKLNRETMKEKLAAETPQPVQHAQAAFNDGGEDESAKLTGEEKWKYDWQHSAALQAEFKELGAYVAYQNANEKGLVKRLGAKA